MNSPLISIITVTYNAEEVIESTLESVSSQSFDNYEHIIVDGQSTDNTLLLVKQYASPKLEIYSKKDRGIYHGMNRGLKYARGKYILFLNAGDRFACTHTLSKYAAAAEEDPDIIYGDTIIVDKEDNILRPRHLSAPEVLTYASFKRGMLICHQAFMVRKEIAPEYRHDLKLSADYDWCLDCIAKSGLTKRINLKAVTIHYLDGGVSQKKKIASLRERFSVMRSRYGLWSAIMSHISFIPRVIMRGFK